MITLDCESQDATLNSLSHIYGVPKQEIKAFLKKTDLERHYEETKPVQTVERELTLLFEKTLGCTPPNIDRVFWFHLTRASYDADFSSGILPLDDALPRVWEMLIDIFRGTKNEAPLRNLRKNGVSNFQYQLKVGNPVHGGPYAMLVRDSAFQAHEMGNYDYLRLPEIVEDICNEYQDVSGVKIHDSVCSWLIPHIIKFWSSDKTDKSCVESAMYYLYCTMHGQSMSIHANTCFDGMNLAVTREQIVKIEKGNDLHNKMYDDKDS